MKTLTIDHKNGHSTTYKLIEGGKIKPIAYHLNTPESVVKCLERARQSNTRVHLFYGDIETGKNWNEEHDTQGYIGLSNGKDAYYPILVHNSASYSGGTILDHCIIQIRKTGTKEVLYKADNFQKDKYEIVESDMQPEYKFNLNINGNIYSRHKTERSAKLLLNKLS